MTIHLPLPSPTGSSSLPGSAGAKEAPAIAGRAIPIRLCSRRGLPCRTCCQIRGGLLPHLFTLTCKSQAVCSLWRFPAGFPGRALPAAVSLWSPDFPRLRAVIRPSANALYISAAVPRSTSAQGHFRASAAMVPTSCSVSPPDTKGRKRRRNASRTACQLSASPGSGAR